MFPTQIIAGGNFKATASTPFELTLISANPPDMIWMRNRTQWGASASKDVEWMWHNGMAQGTAQVEHQSAANALTSVNVASDGFTTYDTVNPPSFASLACTAVTAANPAVVSMANTGSIAVGDFVRMVNVTNMQQISGMTFQVLAVTTNVSITLDLDSSGFAAPGTTGTVIKRIPNRMFPRDRLITAITQANPCVVNLTMDGDWTVGEEVSFRIPPSTGSFTTMSQLNNLKGVVTVVTPSTASTVSQVTVAIDTTGFSAFTLPTSAQFKAGVGSQPISLLVPAGSGVIPNQNPPGMNLVDAYDNRNTRVIHMGATLFANVSTNDVIDWVAYKFDLFNGV